LTATTVELNQTIRRNTMKRIQICGHRGYPEKYPQNILVSFWSVIRAGRAPGNCPETVIAHYRQKITGGDK